MNELLVNNFHLFLNNVWMLKDSDTLVSDHTLVCVSLSQHMLLKKESFSISEIMLYLKQM